MTITPELLDAVAVSIYRNGIALTPHVDGLPSLGKHLCDQVHKPTVGDLHCKTAMHDLARLLGATDALHELRFATTVDLLDALADARARLVAS